MKAIGMNVIVVGFLVAGCSSPRMSNAIRDDNPATVRKKALTSAFSNTDCPYLLVRGRHGGLRTILGSSVPDGFFMDEHTSDGTMLRLWNYHRTKACVLQIGQEARIIETPPGAFLNRENQVVLSCEDLSQGKVLFPDGLQMSILAFVVDADGQYLCVGGRYYDSNANAKKETPITIRSVNAPEKILVTSRMSGILYKSFCFKDKLYVCVRQYPSGRGAGWMVCEVYNRQGGELALIESTKIESPMMFSAFVVIEDICPDQEHMLLCVNRDLPLCSHRYLLDMKTRKMRDLGSASTQTYAGFLNRHVFDRLFKGDATEVSHHE